MTAPLYFLVSPNATKSLSKAREAELKCVHRKTESHLELVARGAAASVELESAFKPFKWINFDCTHPLLDILRWYSQLRCDCGTWVFSGLSPLASLWVEDALKFFGLSHRLSSNKLMKSSKSFSTSLHAIFSTIPSLQGQLSFLSMGTASRMEP